MNNDYAVIGIDPGLSIAMARIDGDGDLTHCFTCDKDSTPTEWMQLLKGMRTYSGRKPTVVCESVFGMPHQDLSSTLKLVRPRFILEGIVSALEYNWMAVPAAVWKKHFNLPGGAANKQLSVKAVNSYWPKKYARFKGNRANDKAEAALMALWYVQTHITND